MNPSSKQLAAARRRTILQALHSEGQVSANTLSSALGVTHETVRKDLVSLHRQGLLRRVHGGAVPIGDAPLSFEPALAARTGQAQEKKRIAAAALDFVPDDGAILIDSGTTTMALAEALTARPGVLAITNSLPIALTLLSRVGSVTTLGGTVRDRTSATAGDWAVRHLDSVRADVAFLGTNAFSISAALATPDQSEAAVKSAFVRSAALRVLLADHTKFGRTSVFRYAELTDIDVLVTDIGLSRADALALERECSLEVMRV